MPQTYSLHVHSVSGIQWRKKWPIAPNLEVAINVDGIPMAQTHRKRDFVPMWNSLLPFGGADLCHRASADVPIPLKSVGKDLEPTSGLALIVHLARIGRDQVIEIAIADAVEDSAVLGSVPTSDLRRVTGFALQNSDSNLVSSLEGLLKILTSRLDVVVKIGGVIAKIHPFAELAYNVLTSVYDVVKKQQNTDQSIVQLINTMVDVYSFTKDVNSLPDIERIEGVVSVIVQETARCALFIREYTAHGFAARLVGQIISQDTQKIQDFMAAFDKHKQSLDWALGVHIAFTINNARDIAQCSLEVAKDTQQLEILKNLNPVKMNSNRDGCLPGTRRDILSLIITELTKPVSANSQNVFWLYGVAGAGKSTIATSICQTFNALGLLGASLFFTRSNEVSSSSFVIRTIAYSLAKSNTQMASEICLAMHQHPHIIDASIEDQFQRLLLEPLMNHARDHIHGPTIIILDALDECGDLESRRRLISLISNRFTTLPLLRILITSRPDLDIAAAFRKQSSIVKMPLDIATPTSLEDIRLYIDAEMMDVRQMHFSWDLDPTWPGEEKINALGTLAAGLFIWASTATKYLRNAHDPNDALDHLHKKGSDLDALYAVALRSTKFWEDRTFAERAQACLAAVVLGKVPMSDTTINALLGLDAKKSSAHVFFKLGCVLQWAPGKSARILHASFGDYLTDHKRCGQESWFIDPAFWGLKLTQGCLQVLNTDLQFNICRLEDSHISNTAVHDLPNRIATYIPAHLSYSSRFWADHILGAKWDEAILADIENVMYNKFPFWLEILSILGEIGIGINALRCVGEIVKQRNIVLAEFLTDALKFVIAFAPAFAHSAPHLYLSALPLAPSESRMAWEVVGRHFKPQSRHMTNLSILLPSHLVMGKRIVSGSEDGTVCVWDARTGFLIAGPFEGHSEAVRCVTFSPDGERLVSGSYDTTVCMWDSRTGVLVAGPIQHSSEVYCVAFSPDGEEIVSGCNNSNLHLWNSRTGAQIAILEGHSDFVWWVAFSPNGDRIVSGSADNTLCIWNVHTTDLIGEHSATVLSAGAGNSILSPSGQILGSPLFFEGHEGPVCCVAFSHDGERIVSGSRDKTVRVWNSKTGALLVEPIQHDENLMSVAFSPDGEHIVSGGNDIVVWNSRTGTLVAGPFRGHSDPVNSVAFSPDGGRIVSGSADHTIRIWDAKALGVEKVESEGHSDTVWSVAFSPNGEQIVSGSEDGTISQYLYGTRKQGGLITQLEGHTDVIHFVTFSPGNGDRIASGSGDTTLCVWDARTGVLIAGPFKGHHESVRCVAFSPDGGRIASGSYDATVRVWDSRTSVLVAGPIQHSEKANCIAFSPDGEQIVSGSEDGNVYVWNSRTGAILFMLSEWHHKPIWCVAFSPDGKRIASGSEDRTVRVWPAQTSFQGHSAAVTSIAFSTDGNRLVSSSVDKTIRILEV
ncbi:WD40 repeat-like protein [Mycena venus]|uniref:WD40 repeat-like protein n=1 Tax=Mycena venus TaxID=2733690 RepID=A0A8H6YQL8_9AGAR|nr:WD40 repeat-like protein [Mycena venus]